MPDIDINNLSATDRRTYESQEYFLNCYEKYLMAYLGCLGNLLCCDFETEGLQSAN